MLCIMGNEGRNCWVSRVTREVFARYLGRVMLAGYLG